jgi:kynurenine formamidase
MQRELIDLSHEVEPGMITMPGLPGPIVSEFLSRADSRRAYRGEAEFHIGRIELVANTGTYLDAPFHRFAGGEDIGQLALSKLAFLPGVVVDLPDGERALRAEHLGGVDVAGRAVLVHTGWSSRWRTPSYAEGAPYIARDAAEHLVSAGAALVGIDGINIDCMEDPSRPAHTLLLARGIPVVEHLTNLERIAGRPFTFFAVPPPLRGLGTFTVRAFAAIDEP